MKIVVVLTYLFSVSALSNMALTVSPSTISESASYVISFIFDYTIAGNSYIIFDFPDDVKITDSNPASCSVSSQIYNPSSTGVSCSVSSKNFTVYGAFGTSSDVIDPSSIPISVTLNSIVNPSSTSATQAIGIFIYSSAGAVMEYSTDSTDLQIKASAAYFGSAGISLGSSVIGSLTYWIFTMTTSHTVPAGSSIQVTFPFWNSYIGATSTSDLLHFIRTTPAGTSISNIDSPLTCSYSTSSKQLSITNGFTSSKTGTISFSVSNIYNPPSSDSLSLFSITIYDSDSNPFLETENYLAVQATTSNTINLSSTAFSASNTTVSTSTSGFLSFTLSNPTYSSVKLMISFPSDIVVGSSATVTGILNIQTTGLTYTISSNTITITNGWSSYSYKTSVSIKIDPVTTASSTKPTGTFTITTYSPNGNAIDTGTGGAATAKAGTIYQYMTNSVISSTDLIVGASTTLTFDMWLSHPVQVGGTLVIIFPSQITITARSSSTACKLVITGLNSAATCQVISSTLTVIGGFTTSFSGGRISFSVDQITNPSTTATTDSFMFYSKSDSTGTYNIDTLTSGVTYKAVVAQLKSVSVTSSSVITGDSSVYTFVINTKNNIPSSGYLLIKFPDEITEWSGSTALSSCTAVTGFSSSITCSLSSGNVKLVGFSSAFTAGELSWTMSSITNAPSTAPSSSFSIYTFDSSNNSIDQKTSGITLTLTTANTFPSISISPSSLTNGASADYSFSIQINLSTPSSAYILIESPSSITLPSTPSCSVVSNLASIICSYENSYTTRATIVFSSSPASSGSNFSFKILSVKNSPSTKPPASFKLYSFTSQGYKIEKKEDSLIVSTNTASTIQTISIAASDSKISASASYTITYLPMNLHPAGTIIYITIPSEFSLASVTCEAVGSTLNSALSCSLSSKTVTINSAFTSDVAAASSVTLKFNGFTNPSSQLTTSAWSLWTVTSEAYLIDKSNSVTSTFTCDSVCLTCNNSPSTCTSCNSGSGYPYLYGDYCHSSCLDGYTDETSTSDKVCVSCDSKCLTCKNKIDTCSSCDTGSAYPYLHSNTCNSKCIDGYWGDGTKCTLCTNPCLTCTTSSYCLTCAVLTTNSKQTYWLEGTCYQTCPSGYASDSSSNTCTECTNPCETCSTSTSTCTSCVSPYKLLSNSCVEHCATDGTYIETDTDCEICLSPCSTCETNTVTCTSCIDDYFILENSCTQTCPPGYVGLTDTCYLCTSPCEYCSGSQTTCTSCIEGYLLEINECVETCSAGYYSDGVNCNECDGKCLTCTGSDSYCTSCYSPKYLLEADCVDSCTVNTYVTVGSTCVKCDSNCDYCLGDAGYCTSCPNDMYLYDGTCISECPSTITILVGTVCELCNSNCETCSGTVDTCTSCSSDKYLQSGSCVSVCSSGYLLKNNKCYECASVCETCEYVTNNCTSCANGKYLYETSCISSCPQGYVGVSSKCVLDPILDCATDCGLEILKNTDCEVVCNTTDCAYDNGYCLRVTVSCGSNKYESGGSCYPCSDPCSNCVDSATYCTSCKADSTTGDLKYLYNGECYAECPSNTLKKGITCIDCESLCKTCALSIDTCTSCNDGYKLYENQCVIDCPSDTTVQIDDYTCSDCDGGCKYCEGVYDNCTACNPTLVLHENECLAYCYSGYFNDSSVCVKCSGCKECEDSADNCIECDSSLLLYDGKCVDSCPEGTYISTGTCESCGDACKTCSEKGSCDSCNDGDSLYEKACISQCPNGYVDSLGVCVLASSVSPCNTGCTAELLVNSQCDTVCNLEDCNFDNQDCQDFGTCGSQKYLDGTDCFDCVYPCRQCDSSTFCTACQLSISTGELLLLKENYCIEPSTCSEGYTQVGVYCKKCDDSCKYCNQDIKTCTSCNTGSYLYNGECISSCPTGESVTVGSVCIKCASNCLTCSGTYDTCTTCDSNNVLQGAICQSVCDSGYTVTTADPTTCKACTGNCITCSSSTSSCLSCKTGTLLYGSTCISACPSDTTILVGSTCVECTNNCATCKYSTDYCTSCQDPYLKFSSQCIETCPSGYEERLGECNPYCAEGCTQSMLYNKVCDSFCNTENCLFDNYICVGGSDCDYGMYQSGSECLNCTYPCNTCASSVYCTSCELNEDGVQMLIYDGSCYLDCPSGTFKDSLQCKDCDSECKECEGSESECVACFDEEVLYEGSCELSCPSGVTVEIDGECFDCDNSCKECAGSTTTCTKCLTGLVLSNGECRSQCTDGYTLTEISPLKCIKCQGCKTCLGSEYYCLTCDTNKVLLDNICYTSCPSGYTTTTTSPSTCIPCDSTCKTCSTETTYCTSCYSPQILNSYNNCQDPPACPTGQYSDSSGICQPCNSNCTSCTTTSTKCTSCTTSYFVSSSICKPCNTNCQNCIGTSTSCSSCNEEYYLNSDKKCASCLSPCKTCNNIEGCSSCKTGLYLVGTTCLECDSNCENCEGSSENCISCSDGMYLDGSACFECDLACKTCDGTPEFCTSCSTGFFADESGVCKVCSSDCKECEGTSTYCTECSGGQTLIDGVCGICKSSCATCLVSFSTCATCRSNNILISGECGVCSGTCKTCAEKFSTCTSCESGRFLSSGSCSACDSSCLTCETSSKYCTSCASGKSLIGNTCKFCENNCLTCKNLVTYCDSCDTGYYLDNGNCFQCNETCTNCFGSSTTCTECIQGYYISGNSCLICSELCLTCKTDSTTCTSCPKVAKLKNNACIFNCPSGKVQVGLSCESCNPLCKTCSGSVDTCTSCASGLVYQNNCTESCPYEYFSSDGFCIPCSSTCGNCTASSTQCTSCQEGFRLIKNTCELICPDGQYEEGGICLECDSMCSTCYKSSIICTKCNNTKYELMDDGVCTPPCDKGEVRLSSSRPCEACDVECKECSKKVNNCTACTDSSLFLYDGKCKPFCPYNTTVAVGKKCQPCDESCEYCLGSTTTCTLCYNNTYLLNNKCVSDCGPGYLEVDGECIECKNIYCNESSASNATYNSSNTPEFEAKPVPFPFSGLSFISAGVVGVSKFVSVGVEFVPSTIAIWGGMSVASWVFITGYIPEQGESGDYRRRLADLEGVGGNAILTVAFFLLVGGLVFHLLCNVMFSLSYYRRVSSCDKKYNYWKKTHKLVNFVVLILTGLLSFHCIRALFSGLCNYSGFQVAYDDKGRVYKPLIFYGYISVLCTFIPIFISQLLILSLIDIYYWLWMFTLDSLIITFLLAVLIIFDIKTREKDLLAFEYNRRIFPPQFDGSEILESSHSIKELIDLFPHLDFTSLIPVSPKPQKLKKNISKSNPGSEPASPVSKGLKRQGSFPLLANDHVEILPETLRPSEPIRKNEDEPFGEEILEVSEEFLDKSQEKDELTMIMDEVPEVTTIPEEPKEFEVSITEYKIPITRPMHLNYIPIEESDNKIQEYTEIIAFTEEDEPSLEDLPIVIEETKLEDNNFDFENEVQLSNIPSKEWFEDLNSESENAEYAKDLGSIEQEQDIDLDKAISDPNDHKLVSVLHKPSGQRITIRKGFKGARIVNLENKVIETLPPVDTKNYEEKKTVVDEADVRFATLTAKTGERVRVKRNFNGARIVDLEKKVENPHSFLIGQTVRNEADFRFINAYPDPDDPEVVVVMHNETGEDVKVRKTFQGAQVLDEFGEPDCTAPEVDRNDYDIPKTIVDKDDVHLATLKHKFTNHKVKVRRNFRGAKIIDLERKVDFPKALQTLSDRSDEPEPLSPSVFENDLDDIGWIVPKLPLRTTEKKFTKIKKKKSTKKQLKPISISPVGEKGYDRRKLANLASLIEDLEDEGSWWQEPEPARFDSRNSDFSSRQKKTFYR